jgi:putative addiction module killer protein
MHDNFYRWRKNLKDKKVGNKISMLVKDFRAGKFGDNKYISKNLYESRIHISGGIRIYYTKK